MALLINADVTISCDDLDCILFVDASGAYSLSNLTGYNSPNVPNLIDITQVSWTLTDDDGSHTFTTTDSAYFPNSAGDNEICLTADDFGIEYVAGEAYTLAYTVTAGGIDYSPADLTFDWPCCGSSVVSNLATNFSVAQAIGCASITLTDTTGLYNASTNPGGYGSPNPTYADISSTLISIVLSNGNTVNITTFIPTANVPYLVIQAADLGYTSATIPDQIATISYSVYKNSLCRIGYKSSGVLLSCNTETCINAKIASTLDNDCSCDEGGSTQTDFVFNMQMTLDNIKYAVTRNIGCVDGKIEALYSKCSGGCSDC